MFLQPQKKRLSDPVLARSDSTLGYFDLTNYNTFRLIGVACVIMFITHQLTKYDPKLHGAFEDVDELFDTSTYSVFEYVASKAIDEPVDEIPFDATGNDLHGRLFIKNMMKHAWSSYEMYAWQYDELAPLSKKGVNWGDLPIGVTILDSLDTLIIMGMKDELKNAREFVAKNLTFDRPTKVSHFETTIRCLAGLISAYELTDDEVYKIKAKELGDRLLPAFDTPTKIPNSYIDLQSGHSYTLSWSKGAVLADFGSIQMEFKRLSFITRNPIYEEKAMEALRAALNVPRQVPGLFERTFDNIKGEWPKDGYYTLGAFTDSFYEYLLKNWILSGQKEEGFHRLYAESKSAIMKRLVKKMHGMTFISRGTLNNLENNMEHLTCFAAGMFALGSKYEDPDEAEKSLNLAKELASTCYKMYFSQVTGLGPEIASIETLLPVETKYILRPEVVESLFYMWRVTHDSKYRVWGSKIALAIEKHCKVEGGYAGLENVANLHGNHIDKQESFFLSETLKYLYLLFSSDSVIPLDEYVFNTEAHPFKINP